MILIKPSTEIEMITPNALQVIEAAGRTCYKSEDRIGPGTAEKFAKMIIERGHETVLEHASATVRFICDRGVSHELVRHRIASFSQESTRYCDYEGGHVCFVIPEWVAIEPGQYDPETLGDFCEHFGQAPEAGWAFAMFQAEGAYKTLRAGGWRPEQARSVLPNSLKTEIVMSANFREWRHFFKLRTAAAAHPQMRELTIPLLEEFRQRVPVVFDSI